MTILGAVFTPIALLCFVWRPFYLLPLLVVTSLFEVGSVFNGALGAFEFGVAPFYMVGILIIVRFAMLVWEEGKLLPSEGDPTRGIAVLLVAFWAWSFVSAFVMPRVFAGIPVYSPREGLDIDFNDLLPLQWTMSNMAQALYLTLEVAAVLYAFRVVKTTRRSNQLGTAFFCAMLIVVGAGLLQRLAPSSYPYEVFNNNPSYSEGFDQEIEGYHRISSTFVEPSAAGSYLSAIAIGLLASYLAGKRSFWRLLGLSLVIVVLLDTTATTGYVGFAVATALLLVYFNPFARKNASGHSTFKGWIAILVVLCIVAGIFILDPALFEAAGAATVEKVGGLSFIHRLLADVYAISLFKSTWGLGVGLGSNRPSSMIAALLSTVGVIGTGLFATALYRLCKLFPGRSGPTSVQMTFWALLGLLVADAIAVPDVTRPALWALFMVAASQINVMAIKNSTILQQSRIRESDSPGSLEGSTGIVPAN